MKTWVKGNRDNGAEIKTDDINMADVYDLNDPTRNKMVDMGLVKIPVCKIRDAHTNWAFDDDSDLFPC